jgi:hypothetical protein
MTDREINCSDVELAMKGVSDVPQVVPKDTPSELIAQDACGGAGNVPI